MGIDFFMGQRLVTLYRNRTEVEVDHIENEPESGDYDGV